VTVGCLSVPNCACFRLAVNHHSVLDRSEILMSGISATASVRRRFARKTDYVIIYGSVSLAQVRQRSRLSKVMKASESPPGPRPRWTARCLSGSAFLENRLLAGVDAFGQRCTILHRWTNSQTVARQRRILAVLLTTNWRTFRKAQFGGRIL
jgi:hypothetical protein